MIVTKEFTFHAAHRDEEADDKCGRLHGHTYKLVISITGHCGNGHRMLLHGDELKKIYREHLEPALEHQYLNETLEINATMENVVRFVTDIVRWALQQRRMDVQARGEYWPWIESVTCRLWETPTMYAEDSCRL